MLLEERAPTKRFSEVTWTNSRFGERARGEQSPPEKTVGRPRHKTYATVVSYESALMDFDTTVVTFELAFRCSVAAKVTRLA